MHQPFKCLFTVLVLALLSVTTAKHSNLRQLHKREKNNNINHCMFSCQLRADEMPGPPREGQLMCTLFLSMHQ